MMSRMQLLLLMTHTSWSCCSESEDMSWQTSVWHEAKRSIKNSLQIISIKETVSLLPKVYVVLFIHAWSGCHAVSTTYSLSRTKLLKIFERNPECIAEICNIFNHLQSTQEEVARAGIKLFLHLYGKHYTFFIIVNFKIEHEANYCIINVLVMGVMLINQRNISCLKCRIFCKQNLLCEFRAFLVISRKSVANGFGLYYFL